jgi:uncharacterized membrane protein YeaQ/YmgE (transglycosylase-associated protein family)
MIGSIISGLIVGVVAKFLMPGRDPGGIIVTILLGVVGAILGGWLGRAAGLYTEGQPAGWAMSIAGAMLILFIYRKLTKK